MNKNERRLLLEKYTSHFTVSFFFCERVEDRKNTATYWPPQPLRTSPCVVLVPKLVWSPNSIGGLQVPFCRAVVFPTTSSFFNSSELILIDFLSPPSYIIIQSPTQSLEWHVWSSSSGNNCHAVHRCISLWVYHGIFTLSHFFSQARLRDFFS